MLCWFWIDVYDGTPDYINKDAGTNFNFTGFKEKAAGMAIIACVVAAEAQERVGVVERDRAYSRSVYEKLRSNLQNIRRDIRVLMMFNAINDAPCPETESTPTTLVFEVYPKLPRG